MVAPSWVWCMHPSAQKNSVYIADLRNLFWATGWLGGQYSISIKNIKTDWKLFEILEKILSFLILLQTLFRVPQNQYVQGWQMIIKIDLKT